MKCFSLAVALSLFAAIALVSCSKHPEVDEFKQIQLHWNAVDDAAENAEHKDKCVIEITTKVMSNPMVTKSKLVEISYEVAYRLDEKGELSFDGRCSDTRFADLDECSWQATCGVGSVSVVKFHNER